MQKTLHLFVELIGTVDSIHFHVPLTLLLLAQDYVLYNSETLGYAFLIAAPVFYRNLCTMFFTMELSSFLGS